MSSSPSRSAVAPSLGGNPALPVRQMSPFAYPELCSSAVRPSDAGLSTDSRIPPAGDASDREVRARALGREEGQAEARKVWEGQLAKERATLADALARFSRDRALYYHDVEIEVVQLALSIARHILHREAQIDPLLLAGVVRVALEKIERATGVNLRVHPNNAADWRRFFAVHLDPADVPAMVEDPAIPPDRCILETSMGAAELGVDVQLKEIETGLMDLLAARPEEISGKAQ